MMDWVKVTDALPPDGAAVMVTVIDNSDTKRVMANVRRKHKVWLVPSISPTYIRGYIITDHITHWAPMPAPTEDEEDL